MEGWQKWATLELLEANRRTGRGWPWDLMDPTVYFLGNSTPTRWDWRVSVLVPSDDAWRAYNSSVFLSNVSGKIAWSSIRILLKVVFAAMSIVWYCVFGEKGCDAFSLETIWGSSSITLSLLRWDYIARLRNILSTLTRLQREKHAIKMHFNARTIMLHCSSF